MRFGSDPIRGSNPRSSAQVTASLRRGFRMPGLPGLSRFNMGGTHKARTLGFHGPSSAAAGRFRGTTAAAASEAACSISGKSVT